MTLMLFRIVLVQQKREPDHNDGRRAENPEDIDIRQRGRLLVELIINLSPRQRFGIALARQVVKYVLQRVDTVVKIRVRGGQILPHLVLVPKAALGHDRVGDRDKNAATDIPREVNQSRYLVVLLRGNPKISRRRHRDKDEGYTDHLRHAQKLGGVEADSHVEPRRRDVVPDRK